MPRRRRLARSGNAPLSEKGTAMIRLVVSIACLLLVATSAVAQQNGASDWPLTYYAHLAVTVLGLVFAMRMAEQAFGRREHQLADTPTFPRYMTSRGHYLLGSWAFIILAAFIFLLIVYLHKEVIQVVKVFGEPLSGKIIEAVSKNEAPYLLIIVVMGLVYLFLLHQEARWNVLLMIRDLIHSWISVPQLGHKIVSEISAALTVPTPAIGEVVNSSVALSKADFRKDKRTVDRIWAELSYMKWWIAQHQASGDDATFFTEPSFNLDQLLAQYDQISVLVSLVKGGEKLPPTVSTDSIQAQLKEIHSKFARLVACYLLYKNGSKQRLAAEARSFGVPFNRETFDNPLRYSVIFLVTVTFAVYLSVYGSAVLYDLLSGKGLRFADQDVERVFSWIMYALSNYGLAILAVLGVRLAIWRVSGACNQSYLLVYCWTFVLAWLVGPLGLTLVAKYNGAASVKDLSFGIAYYNMLRWGIGPGLVAVCITYFMDRQLSSDLPNIDTSIVLRRVVTSVALACFIIVLQLPQLLSLRAAPDAAWNTDKLRVVALGATFVVTLSLALVAQFGLRPSRQQAPLAAQPAE
jgi:hypothetical protein